MENWYYTDFPLTWYNLHSSSGLIRRSAKIKRSGFLHMQNLWKIDNIVSNQWGIGIISGLKSYFFLSRNDHVLLTCILWYILIQFWFYLAWFLTDGLKVKNHPFLAWKTPQTGWKKLFWRIRNFRAKENQNWISIVKILKWIFADSDNMRYRMLSGFV